MGDLWHFFYAMFTVGALFVVGGLGLVGGLVLAAMPIAIIAGMVSGWINRRRGKP